MQLVLPVYFFSLFTVKPKVNYRSLEMFTIELKKNCRKIEFVTIIKITFTFAFTYTICLYLKSSQRFTKALQYDHQSVELKKITLKRVNV